MEVFGTKNLWIIMVSADVDQKTSKNLMVFKVFTWKCANWLGGVAKFDAKKLNGSRNESTARKMARGKTQTAAEWRACIKSHRKFIWFGKIRVPAREIPLASQKSYQNIVFCWKTFIYDVSGEPLGNLGESTARNRPCGKWPGKKSNFSSECSVFFKKMARGNIDFAWEWHRFKISNSKNAWEWYRFWTWGINFA